METGEFNVEEPLLWYLVEIGDWETFSTFIADGIMFEMFHHLCVVHTIALYGHVKFVKWAVDIIMEPNLQDLPDFGDVVDFTTTLIKNYPERLNAVLEVILSIESDTSSKPKYYIDDEISDLLKRIVSQWSTNNAIASLENMLEDNILDILKKHDILP